MPMQIAQINDKSELVLYLRGLYRLKIDDLNGMLQLLRGVGAKIELQD